MIVSSAASTRPFRPQEIRRHSEGGYVLLTILLAVAMIAVVLATAVPALKQQAQRDREEELVNRGAQYVRAIRLYYKKFGRYPAKIEDLESTNNLRFLRKRYKDPMNCPNSECQDFKLLHFGEVKMSFGQGGIPGAVSLNGNPVSGGGNASGTATTAGGIAKTATASQDNTTTSTDSSQSSSSTAQSVDKQSSSDSRSGDQDKTFGGMPIVGVVSKSKRTSVHEFNHKNKYNEWQFVYDPMLDRGGLPKAPNQTPLLMFGNQQGLNPQGTNQNPNTSPFGSGVTSTGAGGQTTNQPQSSNPQ
jgi:type II secretory pathway pseudopilin PulG